MDVINDLLDKKSTIEFVSKKKEEKKKEEKKYITLIDEVPTVLVTTVDKFDSIKKLKILDDDNNEYHMDKVCLVSIQEKTASLNKNMILLSLPDYKTSRLKMNKNLFYMRYEINKNLICNQYISNRYIIFNYTYIDDENYICFLTKKNNSNEFVNLIGKELYIPNLNNLTVLDKDHFNKQLTDKANDYIYSYNYINFNFIKGSLTYKDVFNKCLKVYKKTADLNYIKIIDDFTRNLYDILEKEE